GIRDLYVTGVQTCALPILRSSDLVRVPGWVRLPSSGSRDWWSTHQEPDGSWSPAGFDWNCAGAKPCSGLGRDSFRVTATALAARSEERRVGKEGWCWGGSG